MTRTREENAADLQRESETATTRYHVSWFIDVEAHTPLGAAQEALGIQRDPGEVATIFTVEDADYGGEYYNIDADTQETISSGRRQPSVQDVARVLRQVLDCSALNEDAIEPNDLRVIEKARDVLAQLVSNKLTGETS